MKNSTLITILYILFIAFVVAILSGCATLQETGEFLDTFQVITK